MTRAAKIFGSAYFVACCLLVLMTSVLPSGKGGPVAVFASPWSGPAVEIVAEADGRIVHAGKLSWIAVTDQSDPDLIARLYRAGAVFVASAIVAQACAAWTGASLEKAND
ncbi:hypothetical protein [Roseibium sediminicola]|uniref:Uncharacterized protein n=1 Tax=Roseibium sediminicola TaxID=2933272 RepID=A0ABT0GXI6_9HYPH|nr:hypothetical protein [Roseibium sp. CAU 1639]